MAAKRPIFTPAAKADLERIAIESIRLFGPLQAERYFLRIEAAAHALAEGEALGRPMPRPHEKYRRKLVGAHFIIYREDENGRTVVVRLLHSRMDLASHL